jgi:CheY-like chemotaxis protein
MLRRLIGEGVSIQIDTPTEPLHVRLDPSQLQQVLMNLAVNARDAMPEGGTLALEIRRTDVVRPDIDLVSQQHVELEVRDTGHGMPDDVRRQVFEPFFTTKAVGHGTGLGLSTVYGIVSNAGGSITVESTEGVGTIFRILLPLVNAEGADAEPGAGKDAPRGTGTILVVDDAPLVRGLVQRQLAKLGYTILTATDGVDALEVARAHEGPIDLMVSDVVMPRMGGPALARALRETRPDVPVLFMSGYANDASLLQVMEEIGSGFLEKPFSVTALAERVASLLRVR